MSDFISKYEVGQKVFLECVISECHYNHGAWDYRIGEEWYEEEHLIPAHRVTVAPARRKAEFPKDWDSLGYVSDDGHQWQEARLLGYNKHDSLAWITDAGSFRYAEVEE